MDQKLIFGVVIAFIVIGIVSFALYQQQQSQPIEEEYEPDFGFSPTVEEGMASTGSGDEPWGDCSSLSTQGSRDLCWSFLAGDEQNVRLCDNIVEVSRKVICIEAVAIVLLDESICEQEWPDNLDRRYRCVRNVARENLDYSLCDSMPQIYKDKCIVALEAEDPTVLQE